MKSDQYYIAEVEDKILETVYEYMKDVPRPFGIVLSGGFDSGLLAALTKPDFVYSISFPYGPKYDEGIYRDAIIKHLGLGDRNGEIIEFKKEDFLPNLEEAVKIIGEPVPHFSLAPLNLLMKKIGKGNAVLSGEGPDEYLGGYARYIIFDELRKMYEIPELKNYKGMIDKVLGFFYADENVAWSYKYAELVGYDESKSLRFGHFEYPLLGILGKIDMDLGVIEKMEQKLAEAYGVKFHYPYISKIFAEYCYALPDHLKVRNGVTKWVFREICKKYLPEIMWNRSKMGGPVAPVNQWIEGANGDYDKTIYVSMQEQLLKGKSELEVQAGASQTNEKK